MTSNAVERVARSQDGYVNAFYEIAEMLGIPAQPQSPEKVWREQMRPKLEAALAQPTDALRVIDGLSYTTLFNAIAAAVSIYPDAKAATAAGQGINVSPKAFRAAIHAALTSVSISTGERRPVDAADA